MIFEFHSLKTFKQLADTGRDVYLRYWAYAGIGMLALITGCDGDGQLLSETADVAEAGLTAIEILPPENAVEPLFAAPGDQLVFRLSGTNSAGEAVILDSEARNWQTSEPSIASILSDGTLTANESGAVSVSVSVGPLTASSYSLTVSDALMLAIDRIDGPDFLDPCQGEQYTAIASFTDGSIRAVLDAQWSVMQTNEPDTEDLPSVSSEGGLGRVIGRWPGELVLTVNAEALSLSRSIQIAATLNMLSLSPSIATIGVDEILRVEAIGNYEQVTGGVDTLVQGARWRIVSGQEIVSNPEYEDNERAVTLIGLSPGDATLEARCGDAINTLVINIDEADTDELSFEQDDPFIVDLDDGDEQLRVSIGIDYDEDIDITTDDDTEWQLVRSTSFFRLGTVGDDKGLITPLAVGSADVRVIYDERVVSTITVRIVD